jgi:hypothetical protein
MGTAYFPALGSSELERTGEELSTIIQLNGRVSRHCCCMKKLSRKASFDAAYRGKDENLLRPLNS